MNKEFFNRLAIIGSDDEVKQVYEYIKGEPDYDGSEMYIDFNKIIRMPHEVQFQTNIYYENLERDKQPDKVWYKSNWECIGNAYDQKLEAENIINFKTQGSSIINLISILSLSFKNVGFVYYFADGNSSACYKFRNGKCYQDTKLNFDEEIYLNSLDPKSKLKFIKDKLNLK